MRRFASLGALAALAACGGGAAQTGADGAAGTGGPADGGPALPDAGMLPDVPFARPDASYVPSPGTCSCGTWRCCWIRSR